MSNLKDKLPKGFIKPSQLPESEEERTEWQKENKSWWEKNPMRYDWKDSVGKEEFSREFFEEIDNRFFNNSKEYLNSKKGIPFDELINFDELPSLDVLEIGVGNGSHAQLLAVKAKSFKGIDITEYGTKSTSSRFRAFNISGEILQMDAEKLNFPDNSFDFVWSWGVIHHSSNTKEILKEISRVLRPGGSVVTMVYHRGWWNYYAVGFLRAIMSGNIFKGMSLASSIQLQTDGAMARYYTSKEWSRLTSNFFNIKNIYVTGPKTDIVPLPAGGLKNAILKLIPARLNKFFTRSLKMGGFLVSKLSSKK